MQPGSRTEHMTEPGYIGPPIPPARENSVLNRRNQSGLSSRSNNSQRIAPARSRSVLQRMGLAVDDVSEVPRSPSGVIRSHSGLARRVVEPSALKKMAADTEEPWHLMEVSEVFDRLGAPGLQGITTAESALRLEKFGKNLITPPKQQHWLIKILKMLAGGFQLLMIAGSLMCFVVYGISKAEDDQSLALGLVLIAVVLLSTIFQYYQEGKADKVMDSLRAMTAETVYAMRDGELKSVPAETLVPGDVVKIRSGEKVPADLRILEATDLKVNNAPLTGENEDIKLGPQAQSEAIFEAKNIARSGCNFTSGNGLGVVFKTGDNTFFGQIAKSATSISRPDTLMKREVKRLIYIMMGVAGTLGILFFILAKVNGYTWVEAVLFFIGIIVANVPEGLLPQLTVALALTARRLQGRGVLVSNLEIIETLGAVSVICSDKTGTLTCNRMTVSHVVYDKTIFCAIDKGTNEQREFFNAQAPSFKSLQRIMSLNTDAVFLDSPQEEPDVNKRQTKGDASETAMIKFVEPLRSIEDFRAKNPRLASIPFNSTNKWMLSLNEQEEGPQTAPLLLLMKGAPEKILDMCSSVLVHGVIEPMTPANRETMTKLNLELGKRGERVIAMAYAELDRGMFPPGFEFETDPPNFPTGGLTMVGYVSMIDPPRPSVRNAIQLCHSAGVKVIMVTGDHPVTARSIAQDLKLVTKPTEEELKEQGITPPKNFRDAIVVHGAEIENYTQEDWDRTLEFDEIVFARTQPQQKQEIVKQLTALEHVVAMTGDGVNDAPALKAAHVGIAMYSGAAVAKEAAQLMLLEDDFGAIVDGVLEGRLIFDNLKKCICYVLSSNVPEIIPFLLFIGIKIPLAIETIVILCIDLGTDLIPAVAIAYEGPEDAIMKRPPRSPDQHLVGIQLMMIAYGTIGLFQTFIAYFGWAYAFGDRGFKLDHLRDTAQGFRGEFSELSSERQTFFEALCLKNSVYRDKYPARNCREDFQAYRNEVLGEAQAAYFAAVVWAQMGNCLIRKTQVASIFTKERLLGNKMMIFGFVVELVLLFFLVYVPKVNEGFLMDGPPPDYLFVTIWILVAIVAWDEARKYLCRRWPDGFFMLYSNF